MKLLAAHEARSKYPVCFFKKCFSIHKRLASTIGEQRVVHALGSMFQGAKSCHKVQENDWRRERIKCMLRLYDDADINV